MKRLKIASTLMIIFMLVFSACQKDFLDINHDPNNTSESTVQLTFPAGVASSAYVIGGYYQLLGGFWSQHWTQAIGAPQWRDLDQYNLQTSDFDVRQFGELYSGALNDYEYVRKVSKTEENWSYYLMATVMQAYTYQILADLYDKIPFTEALKGDEGNFTPIWDDGTVVYDGLIEMIDEALSHDFKNFKSTTNPTATAIEPGADDMIFTGDMDAWEAFANTLKLKIYMRQSYARPAVAQAGIQDLYANNASFITYDVVFAPFVSEQNKRNPAYETFVDRLGGNLSMSRTITSFLDSFADPRITKLVKKPTSPVFGSGYTANTLRQGDFYNDDFGTGANIAQLCTPNLGAVDPVFFMSEAESYFLQAEAVARYGVAGDAKALYEAGIEASFTRLGVSGASTLYGAGGAYEFNTTNVETMVESIITQKWIAMVNNQGLEAFLEHNRTHYPAESTSSSFSFGKINLSMSTTIGAFFPKRLLFPDSESKRNPNTPALEVIYKKVWWDVK